MTQNHALEALKERVTDLEMDSPYKQIKYPVEYLVSCQ